MELGELVREALETQILEHEPVQAAQVVEAGVRAHGPEEIAGALLDAASVALRRMVAETDETFDRAELVAQLALDGAVPEENLELLGELLTFAAATAGGVRPPVEVLLATYGLERLVFGAWLTVLTTIKVVSINLGATEADVLDDVVAAVVAF